MTTLQTVELGVLGPLQVRQYGLPVAIPGAKPRAILVMLGLHGGSVVSADMLVELLWGADPPRTAAKALQTHISALRRTLGDGFVLTKGTGWTLSTTEIDASRYKLAVKAGREAVAAGDTSQAVARFDEALILWRGVPELPEGNRGASEKTRWIEGHAALVEDRADALLATGRAAEIIGELEAAVGDAPLRERRWGQLMLALYRAGRQGEALGAYQRARTLLADELGVDPGPDLRRLEAAIVAQDDALEMPVAQQLSTVTRAVTFLLTDIEGSTAAWEADADAMAVALARHDEIVEQVVTSRGGRLIKTRGEGDATFSVFDRPSAAATAAIELQDAILHEPWMLAEPMRIRVALHTGEVELRDGDYFGRAVNRAARLRSLAAGGQILCSGATAELVIDSLPDDVVLADLGTRQLKNLARPEHVFELRMETADDSRAPTTDAPIERPVLPAVLAGPGPFVGRGRELEQLLSAWQMTLVAGARAVLIAGEPGVGKTRLAGEWCRQAYEQGAVVLYGRCDEDLGAPYQPFAEALRSLAPCLGAGRLRGLRGVEALLPLVPALAEVLPDLAAPPRADADTERYALFDAVVGLLGVASKHAPVVLVLDDLHWAAKPTLLLLRHLLRFGEHARVQIVGTYRSTDLDRSHPLAAMLADLHRDGSDNRLQLRGLDDVDVSAYVAEAGYDDEELARALASVTGGNPFFLIEALRHVDESGGRWDPSTLPQGVREAVSRRLSRLPAETNKALAAAAVVGSSFALDLVERVVGEDLIDAFDEASQAGIVIEEPGGRYRFNHAIVRQSLLAELASVRRMRLHQRIAATLEAEPGAEDELLAELAYHYFECAWAGNAAKAVEYCRRAADQAMARLAYEGAADLYDRALHALEELDDELPDRDDQQTELLVARCEALLAAGDVVSAAGAVSQLQEATRDSARLAAWGTCFDGQLSMLTHPERLDEIEAEVAAAAEKLAGLDDAAGEAKAHTVRATCLGRLGRIADCEMALDHALTAARRARDHRLVNAVLANAPLAALWGPNPVPRAGGRCLDVVRLLRITTGSPVVEATSTRCQGVLDAFRGRAEAGRRLIDSARRALTELGMRHALLEVEQFAGIVEFVDDDPAAAEPHLRRAYKGFRRMGLDADTAETAALLARACLALDRAAEADELCSESERLAGHALKASITWRTVRAQLLARQGDHDEARRVAEEAVSLAERTDALVDHGDACLALATVLHAAGDAAGAQAAAERAIGLYELKGAAALAEKARSLLDAELPSAPAPPETLTTKLDNTCVRVARRMLATFDRGAWDEAEKLYAPDVVVESRRKVVGFTHADVPSGDWPQIARHLREGWASFRLEVIAVRGERLALTRFELGTDDPSPGAPHEEMLGLWGIDEDGRMALQMFFDVEDVDAAIAELDAVHVRFEEQRPRPRLENAATRGIDRYVALFADGRWEDIGTLLADSVRIVDRRQGLRGESKGRAAAVAEARAIAALGVDRIMSTPVALRGDCLCLSYLRVEASDNQEDAFIFDALTIAEIGTDGLFVSRTNFDPDDFEGAIAELDARYLAGEAAPYSDTWSVIVHAHAAFNRHEFPATTPHWVNIDHRRGRAFAPGDLTASIRAQWDLTPDISFYIEAVHRLTELGAVVASATRGTSPAGFDAEWRQIDLLTVKGDRISRCEIFEEADIDAALARFEELDRPEPQLENAASQAAERYLTHFAARDWDALANVLADDIVYDDRRRVVNAGIRHGRDAEIASARAAVDAGLGAYVTSAFIAARGERLILARVSSREPGPEEFVTHVLTIAEVNAANQIAAIVVFDGDDFDAAFAELDTRYCAGEAAAHARTWSLIARAYAGFNRGDIPAATQDWVNIDHRHAAAMAPGEGIAYFRASWELAADLSVYIEAVHQLSDLGAVFTDVGKGTSRVGFEPEWRTVDIMTVDGDLINRCELFDEADIDAAFARFDELSRPARRLENAASQVDQRFWRYFPARDGDAMAEILTDDFSLDDRRHAVNAGVRQGRNTEIENLKAMADLAGDVDITCNTIATRGDRLALRRLRFSEQDRPRGAFYNEMVGVVEINADNRLTSHVVFAPDDIDAAFDELDARYLAGEAAPYAESWQTLVDTLEALNRHDSGSVLEGLTYHDHRRIPFGQGDFGRAIEELWTLVPDARYRAIAVHALNSKGAVVSLLIEGTDTHGSESQWVRILSWVFDEARVDVYEEDDLDAALAMFEQLSRPTPRLENAASRAYERSKEGFRVRDWAAIAQILAADVVTEDRRSVVNAGRREGREASLAEFSATAEVVTNWTSETIATRGEQLALNRAQVSGPDEGPETFRADVLDVIETNKDGLVVRRVVFDPDDLDAAFEELDTRYLAGEAAPYAQVWRTIMDGGRALNRHEPGAMTRQVAAFTDHRRMPFAAGDIGEATDELWALVPDARYRVAAVHALDTHGAVITLVIEGTNAYGNELQWSGTDVVTFVSGETRLEVYEENDLSAALARFEELRPQERRLENTASQVFERVLACSAASDWDAMRECLAADYSADDRRRGANAGIRHGRDAEIDNLRAGADIGFTSVIPAVVATRGQRLALIRTCSSHDQGPDAFLIELLCLIEIGADERIAAAVVFEPEDIEIALAELDTRYLAGEAAPYAQTWSVVAGAYTAVNRRELFATAPDWLNLDHRRGTSFGAGDLAEFVRAAWADTPDIRVYVEAVHRLTDVGAVVTSVGRGTSHEGFDAEWRDVAISTVDGEMISRTELFGEADLDAALARFDELSLPAPRLENAASQADERFWTYYAARDWAAAADIVADDIRTDDRRRVVNAGLRQGRDALIAELSALAEVGVNNVTSDVIATRGGQLVLSRVRLSDRRDQASETSLAEVLAVFEVDTGGRFVARILLDVDDIDAAFAELDSRYLAGETAPHRRTWSLVKQAYAALNRRELPATTPDWVNIDHRQGTSFAPGEMPALLGAVWNLSPDLTNYVESVHRLNDYGAVVTNASYEISQEGFYAEWRVISLVTFEGDKMDRCEVFDEADLDAALARFDELNRPSSNLENEASQVVERYTASFAARDWDAMAEMLADEFCNDDRRRVVNAGVREGREAEIENVRAVADVGVENMTTTVLATRGERLVLNRTSFCIRDWPENKYTEVEVHEIDGDDRIVARVGFDLDDIDAAFAELESRYLAGEAAAHAQTWSVIAEAYAAINRRELPATTADWVNIDHRRVIKTEPGELSASIRAAWDLAQDWVIRVEAVHRLSALGAVVTRAANGSSHDFAAEWRSIDVMTVDRHLLSRYEFFDEEDLDAALARFDELSRTGPRLQNAASQVCERFRASFADRDWGAMAEMLADDLHNEDRRQVVNAGIRHGQDSMIEDLRAAADIGVTCLTAIEIATRGERLVLIRGDTRYENRPGAFRTDVLQIAEIDADERIAALVMFDPNDIDAAFEELDARYLAGEAAAHAPTWSAIAYAYAAFNQRELFQTTPNWVSIDHRRGTNVAPGDLKAFISAAWANTPDSRIYIEAVHRLSDFGAITTSASHGSSQAGFEAEWREIAITTVDGDMISRTELFDESDIDAALARFEELSRPSPRLQNAASRLDDRFAQYFAARDWAAIAQMMTDDITVDDRRRVVNAGLRRGRDVELASVRAVADLGVREGAPDVIATRGERLALSSFHFSHQDQQPGAFLVELLGIIEIDVDDRIAARVMFDPDDIDAAFEELDARYLAGEAAPYGKTWSLIARTYAAINQHKLPVTTPDWVNIDHRRVTAFAPGDIVAYIDASWNQLPDLSFRIETVRRLSDIGAVYSQVLKGTSQEGFAAEWRIVGIMTVEGELISRAEIFDETDIDAAIAKFEQLSRPAPRRLENAASRVDERLKACFTARDWAAVHEVLAEDTCNDDRRRVVGAGVLRGREVSIADLQAIAGVGTTTVTSTVMATRGERLALSRYRFSGRGPQPEAFHADMFGIVEVNADDRITARVWFDLDGMDAAFDEFDTRYLAGEAAAHAHTWSVIARAYAAFNRREMFPTTPDWVNIDHRRGTPLAAAGDISAAIRAFWDLTPDFSMYVAAVHRLSDFGAVVSHTSYGTSPDGFDAEWRMVQLLTVDSDLITRCELFDEEDLDTAIARFEELSTTTPQLQNSATWAWAGLIEALNRRDVDGLLAGITPDGRLDDRRKGLRAVMERAERQRAFRELFTMPISWRMEMKPIAIRGSRLSLTRERSRDTEDVDGPVTIELLTVVEVTDDGLVHDTVSFDPDHIDAAFEELDARYLAGEAAAHAHTWSVVAGGLAAVNRHELPPTTRDWADVDHRLGTTFAHGDLLAYFRAGWRLTPDFSIYIEAVHRLNDLGALITHAARGTSEQGFDAEWRAIDLVTVEGDLINRTELFDETDLDAALARFDELHRTRPRLENAAARVEERVQAYFTQRDWDALAEMMADEMCGEDRRHVVSSGVRHGRDAEVENVQAWADVGVETMTSEVIAIRGERLVLSRARLSGREQGSEPFHADLLRIFEIDADERIVARIAFDLDDIDAAFAELDARYVAGEASAYARTWSAIAGGFAALNRQELPATTTDWVNVDHRRGLAVAAGDVMAYTRAAFDDRNLSIHVEAVHRLGDRGAIVSWVGHGTSQEGFDAEWRGVNLFTVERELINRCEIFDESDLDAAFAKFDQLTRPTPRLQNAASRMYDRFNGYLAARDWDAMAGMMTDDTFNDDRRRVVSGGIQRGRDAQITNLRTVVDLGVTNHESVVIATRGERVALIHTHVSGGGQPAEAFGAEMLTVIEIETDNRIAAGVMFDLDDIDAAFDELDARYLAGEAAANAHTWSLITRIWVGLNRHEVPATTPDWVHIDRRQLPMYEMDELPAYLRATWELTPQSTTYVETVHRLTDIGAVLTNASRGTSHEGFEVEWRYICLITFEADKINRAEVFDESDLDAALARFEELNPTAPRVENTASQVTERFWAHFADRNWAALEEVTADDIFTEDRRRVVNAGARHGRDADLANLRAMADLNGNATSTAIAIRGERLVLSRLLMLAYTGEGAEAFRAEGLGLTEINAENQVTSRVVFDIDDIDAAFEELETRYLAGEAAPHAHTWSVVAQTYAKLNRHELPPTTPDWVSVDHRRAIAFAPGDAIEYIRASWDLTPDLNMRIEAVHRLSNLGAVLTHAAHGTTDQGFDAEWRDVSLWTFEDEEINRFEVFDKTDLDAAVALFEQLSRPVPRLENAASRTYLRYRKLFANRDWAAMAELLTADTAVIDHRKVVNSGVRRGRDVEIANMQAVAEIGAEDITSTVIATRGQRVALCRTCISGGEQPGAFRIDFFSVVEINADERIVARVAFDLDDIKAAAQELDARYLAGEASAHADVWSVVAQGYAAMNRREIPPATPDWETVDHRKGIAFAASDLTSIIHSGWDVAPDTTEYIEVVHRLSDVGAVFTHRAYGTSPNGFDAEWRMIVLVSVDSAPPNRCEMFDEEDLDTALAKFDELAAKMRRVGNAASQVAQYFWQCFEARDWAAIAEIVDDNILVDDRRRVVNAGIRYGRDAHLADVRAVADVGAENTMSTVIATRGARLALTRVRSSYRGLPPEELSAEVLCLVETNADNRIVAQIGFEADHIDAAFDELDKRYLANEAAVHAHTWSVIAKVYATFNRHEHPATTPEWVTIDHRQLATWEPPDPSAAIRDIWDLTPDLTVSMEAVHRLSDLGAVVTHVANGTSDKGFDAEWRMIVVFAVEGDMISRYEMFDEAELDAALARFDELHSQTPSLENLASQVYKRCNASFTARDWAALSEILADDISTEDRRRVIGGFKRHGREAVTRDLPLIADLGMANLTWTVIATRGSRLVVARARFAGHDKEPGAFATDLLQLVEIDSDERMVASIVFDHDDIEAAFEELDARYLAGEAAAHARTWSLIARTFVGLNKHEVPATAPDWVHIDHRPLAMYKASELPAYLSATWGLTPRSSTYVEAVHRLTDLGALLTIASHGTSEEGFEVEWRDISIITFEGDKISRGEVFDEEDIDSALARFEELHRMSPRLGNAAARVEERVQACFTRRDWDALAEMMADEMCGEDRRHVVASGIRHGRDAEMENVRAWADVGVETMTSEVIAIRGERVVLSRARLSGRAQGSEPFYADLLRIFEIDANERIVARIAFDLDDIDAAFAELDARYLAGEASAYARTWSAIAGGFAALNRRELPATTTDWVNVDHRRGLAVAAGDVMAYTRAAFDDRNLSIHVEAVHRLGDRGAIVSWVGHGTSQEGFDAEWRGVNLFTVERELINRCEIFDESDLDAALARFDELEPQTPRLENAASRTYDRFNAHLTAGNWEAMAEMLTDDACSDDRRRVVSSGIQRGKDAQMANLRAVVDVGAKYHESTAIAVRGERLALTRSRVWGDGPRAEAFGLEMLTVIEVDTDNRISAGVNFDLDDFDAAFEELETRYLSGEAAAHMRTWSLIAQAYSAFNRGDLPSITGQVIDRRRLAPVEGVDFTAYITATLDLTRDITIYIAAVHRLSDVGAVFTHVGTGTSQEGFDAEWRAVDIITVDGDLINSVEFFDELDIDAALARFEELQPHAPRLENTASQVTERFWAHFADRNWAALEEVTADDIFTEDRRRVVNAGARHGRDADLANLRAMADLNGNATSTAIAIRGERLVLSRLLMLAYTGEGAEAFRAEGLGLTEINAENQVTSRVVFDIDDIDAAFEELETRYLAGEAAPHAHTWSLVAQTYAKLNRHELPPTTPDWVSVDHRRAIAFAPGDAIAYIRASWDLTPDLSMRIEAVHRLSNLGAVLTHAAHGTTDQGFDAEWRDVSLWTFEGDEINRFEVFDRSDLDVALARFDELNQQVPQLENAATRAWARQADAFNRRDLDGFLALATADSRVEDRRKGLRALFDGPTGAHATFEAPASWRLDVQPVAIRGARLALTRACWRDTNEADRPIAVELLALTEVGDGDLIHSTVSFDPDDINGAIRELTARWIATGEVAHPEVIEALNRLVEAGNRHDWDAFATLSADATYVNHRQLSRPDVETIADHMSSIRTMASLIPDYWIEFADVLQQSATDLLTHMVLRGTSTDGLAIEIPLVMLVVFEGNRITGFETYDADQYDLALARFQELNRG